MFTSAVICEFFLKFLYERATCKCSFFNNLSYGSINVPADSPHAVAVGAVDWGNDSFHSYTSRGPTQDLRIKPDLSAPAGVSTQTYGKFNFWGTSASTAHVAGAIALLRQKTLYSYEQILELLKARAGDLGAPGRDNLFGEGKLHLIK